MTQFKCICGICKERHVQGMSPEEFKAMVILPGALDPDGYLRMACDKCHPPLLATDPKAFAERVIGYVGPKVLDARRNNSV